MMALSTHRKLQELQPDVDSRIMMMMMMMKRIETGWEDIIASSPTIYTGVMIWSQKVIKYVLIINVTLCSLNPLYNSVWYLGELSGHCVYLPMSLAWFVVWPWDKGLYSWKIPYFPAVWLQKSTLVSPWIGACLLGKIGYTCMECFLHCFGFCLENHDDKIKPEDWVMMTLLWSRTSNHHK